MKNQALVSSALAAALSLGLVAQAQAAGDKEKCYGIAKAGKNDCADIGGTHSCAGQARVNNSATEWKYVAKGTCVKEGGSTKPPSKK